MIRAQKHDWPQSSLARGPSLVPAENRLGSVIVSLLQFLDIDPVHLKHSLHDAVRLLRVFVPEHLTQSRWDDLLQFLSLDLECPSHHRSLWTRSRFAVSPDVHNF